MILTGKAIARAVEAGTVQIQPFRPDQVNPNSYNFRLGKNLICPALTSGDQQEFIIPDHGLVLLPGIVYLGATEELIGSREYAMTLLGRSSLGRLGLFVNITADLGHIGSCSHWTLELTVVQPLRIYPSMLLGQVTFWAVQGHVSPYRGRYSRQRTPKPCLDERLILPLEAEEMIR